MAEYGGKGRMKKIIDVCCGGRAFWFDKENPDVEFCDIRNEGDIQLCNGQTIRVTPDTVCDFTNLPFEDNTYYLAVFDPPHLIGKKETAWMVKKYGSLPADGWQEILQKGFQECMRVLKPNGVLIFKWNEVEVPISKILHLFGKQPLFGHSSGKRMNTHWVCFMKEALTMDVREKASSKKRLIDANALIKEANAEGAYGYVDAKQIADAPTVDAVEVVRCRECKHCDPENYHCDHPMGTAAPLKRQPDDFCSYGERKEGAD